MEGAVAGRWRRRLASGQSTQEMGVGVGGQSEAAKRGGGVTRVHRSPRRTSARHGEERGEKAAAGSKGWEAKGGHAQAAVGERGERDRQTTSRAGRDNRVGRRLHPKCACVCVCWRSARVRGSGRRSGERRGRKHKRKKKEPRRHAGSDSRTSSLSHSAVLLLSSALLHHTESLVRLLPSDIVGKCNDHTASHMRPHHITALPPLPHRRGRQPPA